MSEKIDLLNKEELQKLFASGQLRTKSDVSTLLDDLTGQVLETVLKDELDGHLGYAKYDRSQKETMNSRNGTSRKNVKTKSGKLFS